MKPTFRQSAFQRGSFLLESLIAVLIVALGVLGLVGLQARAMQNTADSQYRSEAAFLANDYLGKMWLANQANLQTDFKPGGTQYAELKAMAEERLPGARISGNEPVVTVDPRFLDPSMGYEVSITIFWEPPGSAVAGINRHRYQTLATVKLN